MEGEKKSADSGTAEMFVAIFSEFYVVEMLILTLSYKERCDIRLQQGRISKYFQFTECKVRKRKVNNYKNYMLVF